MINPPGPSDFRAGLPLTLLASGGKDRRNGRTGQENHGPRETQRVKENFCVQCLSSVSLKMGQVRSWRCFPLLIARVARSVGSRNRTMTEISKL